MRVDSTVLGEFEVAVPALPRLTGAVDVVWVTPKATQLESALAIAPVDVVNDARVVTLMNGVDHLQVLRQRYRERHRRSDAGGIQASQTRGYSPDIAVYPR